ncbi:MAG: LysR family transcriptional regulator [Lachnospiraceae bacterium]|nr:LysR family transcriptional regulator [Lachnospiraceae bacterium]
MFSLKHYVMEVAKTGSFSIAAEHLFVSQPSLSSSIQRLENRIGEPLFDRSVHPVRLTECGEEYLRAAKAIEETELNFSAFLEGYKSHQSGRLTIGGSNSNMSYVIPPLLTAYRALYPQVEISLVENNIDALVTLLSDGDIDLLVDSGNEETGRFEEYPYQPESLILAVPEGFSCNEVMKEYQLSYEDILSGVHTDPTRDHPPFSLLKDTPFLTMTPETDTGKRERALFRREGFRPNSLFAIRQQSTAFHLAARGIGCAIIADTLVKSAPFRPKLIYYKLGLTDSFRYIKFYQKKGRRLTFPMRSFLATAGVNIEKAPELSEA